MATYIAGVTDYIPQVQPFKPDFNFYQDVMQRKQQKFDMGWKQVNTMYNSMLNAPMTRTDNQEARDKFFTEAQTEIERLGSIDLSLEQNVASAYEAFKPFYEDDYVVNDISWTKKYNDARMKSNSFKNCIDPEKCGGRHWDGGDQYLEYQRKEFMDASAEDALGFARPEYIADPDIDAMSLKYFDESKLSVTQDIDTGQWIVTQTNGQALVAPLQSYLTQRLGKDQKVLDYYKVKSFLLRQSNPEEAERLYNEMTSNTELTDEERKSGISAEKKKEGDKLAKRNFRTSAEYLKAKSSTEKGRLRYLTKRRSHLAEKYGGKGFDMSALPQDVQDEFRELDDAITMQDGISKYFQDTSNLARSVEKMEGDKTAQMDNIVAAALLNQEVAIAASTLAYRDFKQTQKANPYAVSLYNHQLAEIKEGKQKVYDLFKMKFDAKEDVKKQRAKFWSDLIIKGDINRIYPFLNNMLNPSGPGGGSSSSGKSMSELENKLFPMPDEDDLNIAEFQSVISALYPQSAPYLYSTTGGPFYNSSQGYEPPVPASTKKQKAVSTSTKETKLDPKNLSKVQKTQAKALGLTPEQYVQVAEKYDDAVIAAKQDDALEEVLKQTPKSNSEEPSSEAEAVETLFYPDIDKGDTKTSTTEAEAFSMSDIVDSFYSGDMSGEEAGKLTGDVFTNYYLPYPGGGYGGSAYESLLMMDRIINTGQNEARRYMQSDINVADNLAYDASKNIISGLLQAASIDATQFGKNDQRTADVEKSQFALIEMGSDVEAAINELTTQEKNSGKKQTLITQRGMNAFKEWPTFNDDNWSIWFAKNKSAILEKNNLIKLLGGSSVGDNSRIGSASRRFLNRYVSPKEGRFIYDKNLIGRSNILGYSKGDEKINEKISAKPGVAYNFTTNDGQNIDIISEKKYLELTRRDQESYWVNSKVKKLNEAELADIARYEAVEANGHTAPKITNEEFREISFLKPYFNGENGYSMEQAMNFSNTVHNNKVEIENNFNDNLKVAYQTLLEKKGYNSLTPETGTDILNIQDVVVAAISENMGKINADGSFAKHNNDELMNGVYYDILTSDKSYNNFKLKDALGQGGRENTGFGGAFADAGTRYASTVQELEEDNGFQFTGDKLFKYIFKHGLSEISSNPDYHFAPSIKGDGAKIVSGHDNDKMIEELSAFANDLSGNTFDLSSYVKPRDYNAKSMFQIPGSPSKQELERQAAPSWGEKYLNELNNNVLTPIKDAYQKGNIEALRRPEDPNNLVLINKTNNAEVKIPLDQLEMDNDFEEINEEIRDEIVNMEIPADSNPYKIFADAYLAEPSPYSAIDGIGTTSVPARIYSASNELYLGSSEAMVNIKEELQELVDMGSAERLSDGTYQVDLINGKSDDGDDLSISTADGLEVVKGILDLHSEGIDDKYNMNFKVKVAPMSLNEQDYMTERFNVKKVTISGLKNYFKDLNKTNTDKTSLLHKLGYNQKVGTGSDATYTGNPFPDQITFKVYNSKTKTALAALNKDPYLMSLSMGKSVFIDDFESTAGTVSIIPNVNSKDFSKSMVDISPALKKFNLETGVYDDDGNANVELRELVLNSYGIIDGNVPISEIDNETVTLIYDFLKKHRATNLMAEKSYPAIYTAIQENNIALLELLQQNLLDKINEL
jgi:hypothetical protein